MATSKNLGLVKVVTRHGFTKVKVFYRSEHFAVTPMLLETMNKIRHSKYEFSVTHVPTGRAATHVHESGLARQIADRLETLPLPWGEKNRAIILDKSAKLSLRNRSSLALLLAGALPKVRAKKAVKK